MGALVLRGARIVDPSQRFDGRGAVLVQDGHIVAVGEEAAIAPVLARLEADGGRLRTLDLPRDWVLAPGFVDLHAHLREPGYEGKETIASGARAAARGGFTTHLLHAQHQSRCSTRRAALEYVLTQGA